MIDSALSLQRSKHPVKLASLAKSANFSRYAMKILEDADLVFIKNPCETQILLQLTFQAKWEKQDDAA